MPTLDGYRSTHAELRRIIADLGALFATEPLHRRGNAKTAYRLLCDLGQRVHRHLADADRGLYPNLLIHDDPKVKSLAWRFICGERPLRQVFDDHHTRWLENCDFNFIGAFLSDTQGVFALVAQRIDHEERVLLPKLIEIGMLREARC